MVVPNLDPNRAAIFWQRRYSFVTVTSSTSDPTKPAAIAQLKNARPGAGKGRSPSAFRDRSVLYKHEHVHVNGAMGGVPAVSPLRCLLEEDFLVANLAVKTGRLLRNKTESPSEVYLAIRALDHRAAG
jgi:hypothetical protein